MKIAFIFSGQGVQTVGMGKDIYENFPIGKHIFDQADKLLGWSVADICFSGPIEKLTESVYCQPAIYTMSVACLEVFKSMFPSLVPLATAGLSLGEFTALYGAGTYSFDDGLKLLAKRAEFMQEACHETQGAMASVLKGEISTIKEIAKECDVDVANFNSPGQIVISGEKEKIQKAIDVFKEKGQIKVIPLTVAGAFHSRLMKTAEVKFGNYIKAFHLNSTKIPVAQNYVGKLVTDADNIRHNIIRQVSGSVLWEDCIRELAKLGVDTIIEFGPGKVLTGLVKRICPEINTFNINSVETIEEFKKQTTI